MTHTTILVVEDNPITRKMARVALSAERYDVLEAADGATALALVKSNPPDLILQDLLLPDMDGVDLVRRLRDVPACREVPILAFSGFLSRIEEARASSVGFTDFIIKPIPPSELVKSVARHLAVSAGKTGGQGRRVLLVDDDAVQLKLGRLRFEAAGFDVVTAADGVEALEVARRVPVDAIATDVLMPRLDGFGLCLAVRQDAALARLPIVITTSTYLDEADCRLGRRMGANAFVVRTPDFDAVIEAVLGSLGEEPPVHEPALDHLRETHVHRMVAQLERQAAVNIGLFRRCSAQAAALSILGTTADVLASSPDSERVFRAVVRDCVEADGCSMGVLYAAGDELQPVLRAHIGCEGLPARELESFFGHEELFHRVIETGQSIALPSAAIPEATSRDFLARVGPASVMLTPLPFGEQRIGVLLVGSDDKDLTTEERLDFSHALGLQIGQALALSRAFAEAESRVREADVFAELVGKINESLDLDTILQRVAEGARELARADEAVIALPEPSSAGMAVRYLSGADPARYAGVRITNEYLATVRANGERAQVVIPIRTGDRIEGLLLARTSSPRAFTEWDETILRRLADHAAVAIRNSQLFARERQMRTAVEASEANFRLLFASGPLPMWVSDAETLRFLEVNAAAVAHYGYSRDEFLTMRVTDIRPPEDIPRLLDHRAAAMDERRAQRPRAMGVWAHRRKDGRGIEVDLTVHDIEFAGHKASLVVAQDVTERRRAEAERHELAEQLRQSQKMEAIGGLAGGIAHDFNNLLTVITGRSQLLLSRLTADERSQRDVELIDKAAERAAGLTRQLLAFSRKQVLQPRTLGLNSVVSEVIDMLQRTIGEDIELAFTPAPDLGLVSADPGQVEQVLLNLAVNARDAMPQGGRLTLETANVSLDAIDVRGYPDFPAGPYVMVTMSDTGVGMDAPTQARIFEPFFTTKSSDKGTGLGLATVYGIVKQSGGHVRVDSEPGAGTTFTIYLPRVAATGETLRAAPPGAAMTRGTETVLLVEDEQEVRELTREILEEQGYRVLMAGHPAEAVAIAATCETRIDLLVTDVVMPQMGGGRLAERLLLDSPGMQVLYISGYTDDAIVRHGVLNQSAAFVQKPFTPEALTRKVRGVLDSAKGN
jgi:PAS domain S-box-containing protein